MTRILIVKLSSFGDVIHTLPALTDLKSVRPEVEIDWLVEEGFAALIRRHAGVSVVHEVALRRLRWPPTRWLALLRHRRSLRQALRERRYDLVLDVQGLMKSAVLARLAGAPIVGYDAATAREPAAARLYDRRLKLGGHRHIVEQTRRFFAEALAYALPPGEGATGLPRPSAPPADLTLPDRYALAVTAAAWQTKLWPEERWRTLVEQIAGRISLVLPWGNPEERERAERIASGIPGARLLPRRLPSDQIADLAANAAFFVGLDTGLAHLAAAFDVPGVTLFGPTDPGYARPYGRGQRVVSAARMDAITVDAVWAEVEPLLAQATGST